MEIDQEDYPGFSIGRTNYLFRVVVIDMLQRCKSSLNPEEAWILMVLQTHGGPLPTSELNGVMMRDPSTVTRQLNSLAKKNMIERRRNAADGRAVTLHLTRTGRAEMKRLNPAIRELRHRAFEGIDADDLEVMVKCLQKVQNNLCASHSPAAA